MSEKDGGLGMFDLGGIKAKYWHDGSYERRLAHAQGAVSATSHEDLKGVENEVGSTAFMRAAFALGEHSSGRSFDAATTTTAIRAHVELEALREDADFQKRFMAGDITARDRRSELFEMAYPELNPED